MTMMESFYGYMGTGTVLIWYFAAVIYLFLKERRKPVRVMFLYVPLLLLLLFFNPLFALVFEKFLGMEIYFRMLWMIPVTPTLAYTAVRICAGEQGKRRLAFAGTAALLIVISGTLVYRNPLFSRAENIHHVPREVAEICDLIQMEGREVRAAFPAEHLLYVRQYSQTVCMPYGRNALMYDWTEELYRVLLKEKIDVERMAFLAKEKECHYVIFSAEKILDGRMEDYDYELAGQVGEYLIYRDKTMNFSLIPAGKDASGRDAEKDG